MKYDAQKHSKQLKDAGLWDRFVSLRDEIKSANDGIKPMEAANRAYAQVLSEGLVNKAKAASGSASMEDVAAALRAKGEAPIEACIDWAMEMVGFQHLGIATDYGSAPSIKAVALFALASSDPEKLLGPYIKQAASNGPVNTKEDDGGNLHVLDSFLRSAADADADSECDVAEADSAGSDAVDEGGGQPSP